MEGVAGMKEREVRRIVEEELDELDLVVFEDGGGCGCAVLLVAFGLLIGWMIWG